jgi:ubiquinone/menaquinone biosynthesis C-methylase UbiE
MSENDLVPQNDYYAGFLYGKVFDPFSDYLRGLISEMVPENARVLDIGCGTGYQLLKMAPKIKAGIGVDLSERMLAFARKQQDKEGVDHLSFELASAADLSRFGDGEFDLATMTLLLHEMESESRIPALKEMARVSKRQIIADYAVSPGLVSSALMHLVEMTCGIFHYHRFRSYLKAGGAPGLFRRTGLRIAREQKAVLGTVRVWACEKE